MSIECVYTKLAKSDNEDDRHEQFEKLESHMLPITSIEFVNIMNFFRNYANRMNVFYGIAKIVKNPLSTEEISLMMSGFATDEERVDSMREMRESINGKSLWSFANIAAKPTLFNETLVNPDNDGSKVSRTTIRYNYNSGAIEIEAIKDDIKELIINGEEYVVELKQDEIKRFVDDHYIVSLTRQGNTHKFLFNISTIDCTDKRHAVIDCEDDITITGYLVISGSVYVDLK